MSFKTGVDIVSMQKFAHQLQTSPRILQKYLTKDEISQAKSLESRAGLFAAKEAIMKTGLVEIGEWLDVEIRKKESGRPIVYVKNLQGRFVHTESIDVSISHDGDYVVAFAVLVELE